MRALTNSPMICARPMRRAHARSGGVTLVELLSSVAAGGVVMLIGYASWEMGWRGVRDVKYANVAYQNAYGLLNSIEEQVLRANTIQVPDPNNTSYHSIQLLITLPNQTIVRRAYRLVGTNLIMQWKDEGNAAMTTYTNVSAFTATMLDAPTNSLVQLACTCTAGKETVSMTTVAWKRN